MYIKWVKRIKNELLTWPKNGNCTKKLAEIELFTKDFLDIFLPRDWESLNKQNLFRKARWYSLGKEQQFIMWTLLTLINVVIIKRFHSRGHKLCNFIGTNKESFYIKLRPLGQPKRVICLATLWQNELNGDVARFTTHVAACLATNQVVASCGNTVFWLDKITRETRDVRDLRHLLQT